MAEEKPAETEEPITSSTYKGNIRVKVYAPFKVYYDGSADSISAVNATGPFDILGKHHNFMTLLSAGDIIVRNDKGEEKISITRGIMHVKADDIVVFLDV
jgi:F0F1-type ATP synthase epsilon subunit